MAAPAFDFDALSQQHGTVEAPATVPPADSSAPQQTNLDAFGRGVGLGTRDVVEGTTGPFTQLLNAATWPGRAAIRYFGGDVTAPSDLVSKSLDVAGLPQPETAREAIISGINRSAAGAISTAGAGAALEGASAVPTTAQMVGKVLAAQPVRQAVTGGVAGAASGTTAALGGGPGAQTAAGLTAQVLGGLAPGATSGLASATDRALAQTARDKYAIPVAPGQMGDPLTRFAFDISGKVPGTGGTSFLRSQQDAFNTAVGKTFGAEADGGKLTPTAMTNAYAKNAAPFQAIAQNTTVPLHTAVDDVFETTPALPDGTPGPQPRTTLEGRLQTVRDNVLSGLPSDEAAPVLRQIDNIFEQGRGNNASPGVIPSKWLVNTLGVNSPLSRGAAGTSTAKEYFGDVRDALKDALAENASPADQANLATAQQNWKNMRTVDRLVAQGNGDVSPGGLTNAVAGNKYQRAAYTGGGDLGELGEIGKRFIRPLPSSGTTERGMAGLGMLGAGAIGEDLMTGDIKGALWKAGGLATTYGGALGLQQALQAGARNPTVALDPRLYYARALMNPPPTQPPLTFTTGQ